MFNNYKGTTLYKVLSPTSDCNFFAVSSAGNQPKIGTKKKRLYFHQCTRIQTMVHGASVLAALPVGAHATLSDTVPRSAQSFLTTLEELPIF